MSKLLTLLRADNTGNTPATISGLTGWYDAADVSTIEDTSGSVDVWKDKSGSAYNAVDGAAKPTTNATSHNGLNVIDFTGSQHFILPSDLHTIPMGDNTVFAVSKRTSEDASLDGVVGMGESGVNNGYFLLYNGTAGQVLFRNRQAAGTVASAGNTNTNFQILRGRRSGTTQAVSVDGATETTAATATDPTTVNIAYIGNTASASLNLVGSIGEVLIYNRSLSADEISIIETYLANKWGVTL